MNGIDWAGLVTAIIGILGVLTVLLRQRAHAKTPAAQAHPPAPPVFPPAPQPPISRTGV